MKQLQIQSIAAIVLAGGRSSRMGRDKALISINEQPLLQQICNIAGKLSTVVYVVTPWIEKYQDILPENCKLIREVPSRCEIKPHGPLVGFAQGLAEVKTEWVLLLACDLPRLTESEVQKWIAYLPEVSSEAIATLPKNPQGWWEPLCGFYRSRCLLELEEYIDRGGRSFQDLLARYFVQELPVTDFQLLFNCNTPEDLEELQLKK